MSENYLYQCSECGQKYNTSGPWEFYRNKKGARIPYGFPGPLTEEARLRGIHGFFADMLCLDCGKEVNVILEDFYQRPKKGFIESLKNIWNKDCNNSNSTEIKCPNCESSNLFLVKEKDKGVYYQEDKKDKINSETNISCPNCHKGKLKMIDQWSPSTMG